MKFAYLQPISKCQMDDALDRFAELLSLDIPLTEIASRMELTIGTVCVLFHTIRQRLGEQAR